MAGFAAEGSARAGSSHGWRSGEGTSSWMAEPVEIPEKCCFKCKEDGDPLIPCDFKNCPKVYHPGCVGTKDDHFLDPGKQFICEWHLCVNCKESNSEFHCLCCRVSVCHDCLYKVEFIELGIQRKGLCICCLNQAILTEENLDFNPHASDESHADDIDKVLFKNYWEDVKVREHLTLVNLEEGRFILNKRHRVRENTERFSDEDHMLDANMVAENAATDTKGKQKKVNSSRKKNKSNKKTYIGWCSEELMHLLQSFGNDSSKPLDKFEITRVIMEHIKQNNLFEDNKKKTFLCDHKLQPLFRRRKVRCKSIPRLLAVHLATNAVAEDEIFYGSEDDDDGAPIMTRKPKNSMKLNIAKWVSESDKSRFASLNENNLKLIYLRRSLVTDLLNEPDTFEQKVVGSFVRIKHSLKGRIYAATKKQYQLGLVTGIRKSSEEYKIKDTCTNILLCVTGMLDDVKISVLSDEDLSQEECNDLVPLVEKGLLKRPTIAVFKEKVATVHTDIVNHWIGHQLEKLERRINDIAHLKGWHAELAKLLDQKKLLSTDAERKHRLEEVPEIVPDTEHEGDETELQIAASNYTQENRGKKRDRASCFVNMEESSKGDANNFLAPLSLEAKQQVANSSKYHQQEESPKVMKFSMQELLDIYVKESQPMDDCAGKESESASCFMGVEENSTDGYSSEAIDTDKDESKHSRHKNSAAWSNEAINQNSDKDDENPHTVQYNRDHFQMQQSESKMCSIPVQTQEDMNAHQQEAELNGAMDVDHQGEARLPFPLKAVSCWKLSGFFDKDLKVWRIGETAERAILLKKA